MDKGGDVGNYFELLVFVMFVYFFVKGVWLGYLIKG